jgi:hypothetical protein
MHPEEFNFVFMSDRVEISAQFPSSQVFNVVLKACKCGGHVSFRLFGVRRGGVSNENCSQSHPHLKVHHLHLALTVSTCILAGGVCGGALSRRGRLETGWWDTGERVREKGGNKAEGEFRPASVITHSYLGGVWMDDRHSVQIGRRR